MTDLTAAPGPARESVLPTSPRAMLLSIASFEALIVLYMFAGLFKGDPRFAWIPADPTGLFFAMSLGVGAFILVLTPMVKHGLYPVVAYLAFAVWFGVTLFWSPSRAYGPDKVFFMGTLVLWAVVAAAMIIAADRARMQRLFMVLVIASTLAAYEAISVYLISGGGRLHIGSGSYLGLGRLCGLGAAVMFVAWLFCRRRFGLHGLLCLGLFGLFVFVLVIGGGRGPLLSAGASLLLPLLAGIRGSRYGVRIARYQWAAMGAVLIAAVALTAWVQSSDQVPETFRRFERIITGDELGASAGTRLEYYDIAPALWGDAPLIGHGAGAWPLLTGRPDIARYPHNLFVEVVIEGGLIGLALLIVLFVVVFRPVSSDRLRSDPLAMCALMLFVNTFLNSMVSGDLSGNRAMFLMLGLLTVFAVQRDEQRPAFVSFLRRPAPAPPPVAPLPSNRRP